MFSQLFLPLVFDAFGLHRRKFTVAWFVFVFSQVPIKEEDRLFCWDRATHYA